MEESFRAGYSTSSEWLAIGAGATDQNVSQSSDGAAVDGVPGDFCGADEPVTLALVSGGALGADRNVIDGDLIAVGLAGAAADLIDAPGVACGDLVRRFRHSTYLDFTAPQECPCCRGKLEVKDHRAPWFSPPYTASKEWRYEVTCETCGWCDCNGYANRCEVLAAYPTNVPADPLHGRGKTSPEK